SPEGPGPVPADVPASSCRCRLANGTCRIRAGTWPRRPRQPGKPPARLLLHPAPMHPGLRPRWPRQAPHWRAATSCHASHAERADAVFPRRDDIVRIERALHLLVEAKHGMIVEAVALGHRLHEVQVRAVFAETVGC